MYLKCLVDDIFHSFSKASNEAFGFLFTQKTNLKPTYTFLFHSEAPSEIVDC